MKNIDSYISEKLKINKDIIENTKKIQVKSKIELLDIIHKRLAESKDLDLTDIDISGLDDGDLIYLFENEKARSIDMIGWDLSKQTDIHGMFWMNDSIEEVYCDDWDTSNVKSMYGVFKGCYNLKKLDVSNWDVSDVIEFTYMFENCISLPSDFNVDKWKPKRGVNVINMFANDKQLKQPSWWRKI